MEREELIIDNPFKRLKTLKPDNNIIQAVTPAEIERLIKTCSRRSLLDIRNKAILSIFLATDLHLSELINLTSDDINMDDGSILVKKGKGGKPHVVRIGNKAQRTLWKYVTLNRKGSGNRLFLNRTSESFNSAIYFTYG